MTVPWQPNSTYIDNVMKLGGFTPDIRSYASGASDTSTSQGTPSSIGTQGDTTQEQTAAQGTAQSQSPTSIAPSTEAGQSYKINVGDYSNPGVSDLYKSLFSPITSGVQTAGKKLQDTTSNFVTGLGNRRTWESLGGEGYMNDILSGAKPEQEGKDLIKASYSGGGLDQASIDELTGELTLLKPWQNAFKTGQATEDLLQQSAPNLTTGERKFEAKSLRKNPDYVQSEQNIQKSLSDILADYDRSQAEARGIAQQKAADESGIAQNTQTYLKSAGGAYETAWDKIIADEQAKNKTLQDAWTKFQTGPGVLSDLNAIPESGREGWTPDQFSTDTRKRYEEGAQVYNGIVGDPKYASIKDVPLMSLAVNDHGYERMDFDPEWWAEHQGEHTSSEWSKIKELARQRQKDLKTAGFEGTRYGSSEAWSSPYGGMEQGRYTGVIENKAVGGTGTGKYSDLFPLYFGNPIDMPTLNSEEYFHFDPGVSPARQNVSTEDQRAIYNRIQRILDEVIGSDTQMQDPEEAYRAAKVVGEIGDYLADETKALNAQKGELVANQNEWRKFVQGAHAQYEHAKKKAAWGKVGKIVGGIAGSAFGPLGPVTIPAGVYLGGKAGEDLA
jgi:hypothetical protein